MKAEDRQIASKRKQDHIDLAFKSQLSKNLDDRFYYEPLLSPHPELPLSPVYFAGKQLAAPIWVSSMTGGTAHAQKINHQLAKVCREFGLGMGLGSCRSLLYSDKYLADFAVRKIIGDDLPLYANLGIAQVEELIELNKSHLLEELVDKLEADGLIIHVNPTQEWLQPEGDRFNQSPLSVIKRVIESHQFKLIIKEVGQGFGYESLKELIQLPLAAIEFGAHGGTNFALLELLRGNEIQKDALHGLALTGHSPKEMLKFIRWILAEQDINIQCQQLIISGGIRNFLDGYYFINKSPISAIYGQAAPFLKYALRDYEDLHNFVRWQIQGLAFAETYLRIRK